MAARTMRFDESGALRLISKHGFTLKERGLASGTVRGTLYVTLKIVSSSRVTVEVGLHPRGGWILGFGSASYRRGSSAAYFSGTISIDRGSGTYSRIAGSGLSFGGTIQRSNDAIVVRIVGSVRV